MIEDGVIAFNELSGEENLRFYGVAFVLHPGGQFERVVGSTTRAINLRSILKLVRGSLLMEKLGLNDDVDPAYAVLVGSHDGLEIHRAAVSRLAETLSVDPIDVLCTPIPPQNDLEALRMVIDEEPIDIFRHQCLGEHLGVLRMCREMELSCDYDSVHHPVHGPTFELVGMGGCVDVVRVVDRCRMPTLILPAAELARLISRLLLEERPGFSAVQRSIAEYPEVYAGVDRFSSRLAKYSSGRLLAKESASGGFVAWNRDNGSVIVSFCSSGCHDAAEAALVSRMRAEGWVGPDFGGDCVGSQMIRPTPHQ